MISDAKYPLVLAEMDPAYLRLLPFLSKRRRSIVRRIRDGVDIDAMEREQGVLLPAVRFEFKQMLFFLSTRTLEMVAANFGSAGQPELPRFFEASGRVFNEDELLLRAIMSYGKTLESVLPESEMDKLWHRDQRSDLSLQQIFRIARSAHRQFFSYEDVSAMTGEVREQFSAIVAVLSATMFDQRYAEKHCGLSSKLTDLIIARPDRAHDIIRFQKERNLLLDEIRVKPLIEYLDTPATSLSVGLL